MWICRSVLCVSLVCGLALDSNTIRSSREEAARRGAAQRGGCSNRAQRRPLNTSRLLERPADGSSRSPNRTRAPEMSACVRSGDCAAGLCCARYLTGKRCQRILAEGEACLLRGPTKLRRNLGRCDCSAGLACTAASWAELGRNRNQGVCMPEPRQARRKTRQSGKKKKKRTTVPDHECPSPN